MTESLIVDWLNENENRAYPLQEGVNKVSGLFVLPDSVVLDASLVYDSLVSDIELTNLVVGPTSAVFTVTGAKDFTVTFSDPFPQYVRLGDGSLLVVGEAVKALAEGSYAFSGVLFEEATVIEQNSPWKGVLSLSFGSGQAFTGDVLLRKGIQFEPFVSGNTLILRSGRNEGTPLNCSYKIEQTPSDCDQIISTVNGIASDNANRLSLTAGEGLVIVDDPDNHRIFVGLVFAKDDICKVIYSNPLVI